MACLTTAAAACALALGIIVPMVAGGQPGGEIFAVGARHLLPADPAARARTLEEMRQAHFNVVALPRAVVMAPLSLIDRLLARAPDSDFRPPDPGLRTVAVRSSASPAVLAANAWLAIAQGASAVVFDDWATLRENPDFLTAASEFAGEVTRNAPLYAAVRPRVKANEFRIDAMSPQLTATFLESEQALVLLAINLGPPRQVTFAFSPEIPEAVWQNMLGGGAVNFVAGPDGPTYTRSFAGNEVLVLMIRKRWR